MPADPVAANTATRDDEEEVLGSPRTTAHYWSRVLSRRERIRLRLTWPYWRQTRLIEPLWSWWVNRAR